MGQMGDMGPTTVNTIQFDEALLGKWEQRRSEFGAQVEIESEDQDIERETMRKEFDEIVNGQQGLSEWTDQIFDLRCTRYIPDYINTVSVSKTYVSTCANLTSGVIPPWCPPNAMVAFGSYDGYAQGLSIPLSNTPTGNISNTFIVRAYLSGVENKLPYAVGVTIGELKTPSEEEQRKLRQGKQPRFEAMAHTDVSDPAGKRVHGVIPPGKTEFVELYRSHEEINHKWGGRYPNVTAATVVNDKVSYGDDCIAVPVLGPVAEHIIEMGAESGYDLPEPVNEHEKWKGKLIVTNRTFNEAVKSVKEILQRSLPIQDLSKFCMEFDAYNKFGCAQQDIKALTERGVGPMCSVHFTLVVELVFREQL